jgi:putative copper export protein
MDIAGLIESLEESGLATTIRNSLFLFPLIESVHVIGLTMVFGTIVIIDLRLLGIASTRRPFTAIASDVFKWTWMAFAVTATTGALMFITNASTYYQSAYFRAKMALLALSGLNMLVFELTARRSIHAWDRKASAPASGRAVAVLSLVIWIGVIVLGRWIGFTTSSTPAQLDPGVDLEKLEELLPK